MDAEPVDSAVGEVYAVLDAGTPLPPPKPLGHASSLLSQRDRTAGAGHAFTQDSQRPSSLHPSSIILPELQSWVAQTGLVLPRGERP